MKMLAANANHRDVIVIGGSAGCFHVLREMLAALPTNFPAAVLITTHLGPSADLVTILKNWSVLPLSAATTGASLREGEVHVAVPDAHLLVHDHHLLVRRGPSENLSRPAIDPLFRSAACALGPRVIGVLLSGDLNDGTAGLAAIQACGGVTVVQDPADAAVASMPQSAIRTVRVDHCVPGSDLPALLVTLTQQKPGRATVVPQGLKLEVAISAQETSGMDVNDQLGKESSFSCPDCEGVLWQIDDDQVLRFRCHVGHAVTAETLLEQKGAGADAILWRLLRTHEERAELAHKLAGQMQGRHDDITARLLKRRAAGYEEDASIVRGLLAKFASGRSR